MAKKSAKAKVVEAHGPLTFIGPGIVGGTDAEIERRLAYACSERGNVLTKNTSGPTYGVIAAHNGAVVIAPGASLATVKTHGRVVDPGIP